MPSTYTREKGVEEVKLDSAGAWQILKICILGHWVSWAIIGVWAWFNAYFSGTYATLYTVNSIGEAHVELVAHVVFILLTSLYMIRPESNWWEGTKKWLFGDLVTV